jgi:quinohemoprotein ethanol dehydrogenase
MLQRRRRCYGLECYSIRTVRDRSGWNRCVIACLIFLLTSLLAAADSPQIMVDAALRGADQDAGNWLMYGRTDDGQRHSPLSQINEETVGKLGLVWSRELDTTRGLEATPLVQDGVIYTTGAWSMVFALDATTGQVRWTYDPKVPRDRSYFFCCDVVNRGLAQYRGKLYLGALDGRLIALDQKTGAPLWVVQTVDHAAGAKGAAPLSSYSITGAPCVAKGLVIIGNAGGEFGVRGYVSAYDAETGKMVWRCYTVPGNPSRGFESKALERAAKTWNGQSWKTGGGGPAWDSIIYDPTLDLLYFGTGNATSWYRVLRGGGDNLYAACILAVRATTGEIVWHFQTTPGDNWDYDATAPLIQAELKIADRVRKVLLQANKNGFFYVLDRETGEFLSGTPFVEAITWAAGLDPVNGRPIEVAGSAGREPVVVSPDPAGAHNWSPMAFSPATGLVYFPARIGTVMLHAPDAKWKYRPNVENLGLDEAPLNPLLKHLDELPKANGELVAWDPVKRQAAWRTGYPVVEGGGVLATGGNLVFQGRGDGMLAAYRATDGRQLWTFDAGTGIMAPPVTYTVNGIQYVSVMAGWGGLAGLLNFPGRGPVRPGYGRILTFTLGATATLHAPAFGHAAPPAPAGAANVSQRVVRQGSLLYSRHCMRCHGVNAVGGVLPDLRYCDQQTMRQFEDIVLRGARTAKGMPSFAKILNSRQLRTIQTYIATLGRNPAPQ